MQFAHRRELMALLATLHICISADLEPEHMFNNTLGHHMFLNLAIETSLWTCYYRFTHLHCRLLFLMWFERN